MNRVKPLRILALPLILAAYALIYLATTKREYCDERCEKMRGVARGLLDGSRPYLSFAGPTHIDTVFAVGTRDRNASNWNLLTDTVCQYLQAVGLPRMRVVVIDRTGDTLTRRQCP